MIDPRAGSLEEKAVLILQHMGQVNDLEAMAKIIDMYAHVYREWDTLLPELSHVFLGIRTSGPATLLQAQAAGLLCGKCLGLGRGPVDCPKNGSEFFTDQGFHPDFLDGQNQLYHAWGYVAQTAVPGSDPGTGRTWRVGVWLGHQGNYFHEVTEGNLHFPDSGRSWEDFTLSESSMAVGLLISFDFIAPHQLGDVIRVMFGVEGPGSGGRTQRLEDEYGPL